MLPDKLPSDAFSHRGKDRKSGKSPKTDRHPFPVVAVGASAGGLEAFTGLLQRLPANTGMAFVLIQHLAPSHESMLAHLLSRETAMPVKQIEDGAVMSPDHVYVIPPNAAMTVSGLELTLKPRAGSATAIDEFLRSLASSQKSSAVAVILSGTGSDGALGVQAIAEAGGVVFAQDPATAKFDGMPRSAIATGCVDSVLPVEAIAAELARIAREPRIVHRDGPGISRHFPASEKEYRTVIDLLRAGTGIDFNLYRQATFRRRVLRRTALLGKESLAQYESHLRDNPDEMHALAQDILIRVTQFFRDPEAFDVLTRKVFPALIRKTPLNRVVRVWVPGCSTGEEAYSIGICFLEVAEQMESRVRLQVFATDINEAAIEKARRGSFIENISADVSPERLARFFTRAGGEFQVAGKLRNLCNFSRHDLLNDPPFSRMGLVSCRNVLIYFDSMQGHAFSKFHFALDPGGFLLLGKSETTAFTPGLFSPLDKAAKLYVRQESAGARVDGKPRTHPGTPEIVPHAERPHAKIDPRHLADRVVIERYGPPRVIVTPNLEIVAHRGETAGFVPETRNEEVLELVKKSRSVALKNAVRTAGRSGQSVTIERVSLGEDVSPGEIDVEITPLGPERQSFLVAFEERPVKEEPELESGRKPRSGENKNLQTRNRRLQKELASSRAHLESVIVEQEAAHEEVVAANEELQSLNEELEGSKEELEATNEELTTVNQELQVRNTELENAREFAQATIDTVRGSLVVLGPDLRVQKANQTFYRTFRLSAHEVEHHFIYEIGNASWSIPRLRVLLEEVLPKRRNMTDFEMEQELPSGTRRILVLNARRFEHEDRILLAIEDVTESRRLEEDLRQSQKMEAIGYLAAGVAHDFNNLMTGVIGNASLLLQTLPENDPGKSALDNIVSGGRRAAELTRQLLAYAGKGRFFLQRVDLAEMIVQTAGLMHASIPQDVQLRLDLDKHLPLLLADPGQFQQVVMNLMINAVEAIGDRSGVVHVRTGRQHVTGEPLPGLFPNQNLVPGDYIFMEVLDNGQGMGEQTINRIFDPFYSTKFSGRGLGLAAVLGVVRQHKAAIQVHSVPGRGTSFRVLFPIAEKIPSPITEEVGPGDLRGSGLVLVVDDEELIREFSKSALEPYGYRVLLAGGGEEALRLFRERPTEIALVLLDLAMPGMDGIETLDRMRDVRPDIPVMVCSGFGDVDVESRFTGKNVACFLAKPYTVKQLAGKVKECLAPETRDR